MSIIDILEVFINEFAKENILLKSLIIGIIPAVLTTLGAIPALIGIRTKEWLIDASLGFSAGIMIVASFTSLLIPALNQGSFTEVMLGFLCGVLLVIVLNRLLPHEHLLKGYEGPIKLRKRLQSAWLIALALIIHNIPEGMAIGASLVDNLSSGIIMSIAIGIQDFPEGFATALPLIVTQRKAKTGFMIAFLSGISETLMCVFATALASIAIYLLPFLLSLAAGAMIFVTSHEVIPETHRYGHEMHASMGLIAGFITMLFLDTILR